MKVVSEVQENNIKNIFNKIYKTQKKYKKKTDEILDDVIMPNENINKIINGNCVDILKGIDDNSIDMVMTSPPYDNIREYNGYSFDFENIANELFRILKTGGVMIWVVNDKTENGSESGTCFKQALYFKSIGFNIYGKSFNKI